MTKFSLFGVQIRLFWMPHSYWHCQWADNPAYLYICVGRVVVQAFFPNKHKRWVLSHDQDA